MNKAIFLDRDGVLNKDYVDYVWTPEKFEILPGVVEGLQLLKDAGYLLIVITNQSGIAKGIYTHEDVDITHTYFQGLCNNAITEFFYSPYHESKTASLSRKPNSFMLERAIAKYNVDIRQSYMIGDKDRDTKPARTIGLRSIAVDDPQRHNKHADMFAKDLLDAAQKILASN
ncbi:MAG: HAD family hydrolase [Cytophagales bacterium]|jgi:D-glycero-D-manno-heptose 1,7-bisphosphate phosphatase